MRVSVIIVAYKNYSVLRKCLQSMREYNDIGNELEIIVVDNTQNDDKNDEDIKCISALTDRFISSQNNGFGAGNNIGARYASGDILAFINPDIIFIESIYGYVSELFERNNNIGMLGLKLLTENHKSNYSFFYDFDTSYLRKKLIKLDNMLNRFNASKMYTSGSNMFIRRELFEAIGGFDENIFMYFEELDLKKKISIYDPSLNFVFDPSKKLVHLDGSSTPNSVFSVKKEIESTIYIGKKYKLNYQDKLKFERNYRRFKRLVFSVIRKRNRVLELDEQIKCYQGVIE